MANNELPDIDVGNFVEDMLRDQESKIREGSERAPDLTRDTSDDTATEVAGQLDISNIEVPDTLMEMWTGKEPLDLSKEVEPVENAVVVSEETTKKEIPMDRLPKVVKNLQEAVIQAQNLILEMMTTVGTIGVNMAGPEKKTSTKKKISTKKKKKKKRESTENRIIADALKEYLED